MGIKYKTGSGSLPGIPARDLTDDEVKKFGRTFLLKTGLYYEDKPSINRGTILDKKMADITETDEVD